MNTHPDPSGSNHGTPPPDTSGQSVQIPEFLFRAVHDLQEPLRVASGFAKLLSRRLGDSIGDDGKQFLDEILRSTRNMQRLVDDILEMAHSSNDRLEPKMEEFAAADVVKDAWSNIADSHNAALQAEDLPSVFADQDQIRRVFQNLFSNAIKFHREGTVPKVQVHVEAGPDRLRFAVEDNGQGIDERELGRVFEPFRRAHGREIPGSGLGLAICKQIVEAHGGRLWAESKPGHGSTFFFELPAKAPPSITSEAASQAHRAPAGAQGAEDAGALDTPWRVVLTDDVAALRRLVKIQLENDGRFRVVGEAGDGEDALETVERTRPDLLLLDLSMPKMDGLEVLSALKRRSPGMAVVVLSGFTEERMGKTAVQLGADDYIEKGIEPQKLAQRLSDLLGPQARAPAVHLTTRRDSASEAAAA